MPESTVNFVSATIRQGLFTRVVGRRVLFYQEIGSTMDEAARLAREKPGQGTESGTGTGTVEGTVVVAESQTMGRGRFGRNWVSPEGNIYLSVVFRPTMENLPFLSILAGVATVQTIGKITGLQARIKWPNDVMVGGLKAAGILVESVVEGDSVCYAVLGIGLNVGLDPKQSEETAGLAISLESATGRKVSREEALRQLLQDLDSLYLKLQHGGSPLGQWREMLDTLGRNVRVSWSGGGDSQTGYAEDIDNLGNLLLRLDDGSLITVTAGDVTLAAPGT